MLKIGKRILTPMDAIDSPRTQGSDSDYLTIFIKKQVPSQKHLSPK
jgi:hypothetical protein